MFKLGVYMTASLLFEVHFPSLNYASLESNMHASVPLYEFSIQTILIEYSACLVTSKADSCPGHQIRAHLRVQNIVHRRCKIVDKLT